MVEVRVSDQRRANHARSGLYLWQALAAGRQPAPGAEQRPDPEPESRAMTRPRRAGATSTGSRAEQRRTERWP